MMNINLLKNDRSSRARMIADFERGTAMNLVAAEARRLLVEFEGKIETSKPEIVSELKEFGPEIAGIMVENVVVWDNGSIDLEFGKLVPAS